MTLEGHTVSLQLNGVTYSTQTDAAGVATFSNIVPDVYNISASWDIRRAYRFPPIEWCYLFYTD